ncbi:hypothetical protein FNV43_RR26510 [Rhamnella rubrinervis]|uniref:Cytokinin riboside 5'-monophosphate phosphoribohydrolase n=1 Tax=Rhamnella rubrinervis TaxID=2594499 RepID=A0A8K0DP82_9ROSA|nr:hypothetical protein FNV43_RR26510 [Rhamnella rubrinervis]
MGTISLAAHVGGSKVLGIIPKALTATNITWMTVGTEIQVSTMHERIYKMLEKSDAFIALPGGYGTLEKKFQMLSWSQLNIHRKPIGLLNVNNFFDGLLSFLNHAVEQNFISHSARQLLVSASTADELIDKLQRFVHAPDPVMVQIDWSEQGSKKRSYQQSPIQNFSGSYLGLKHNYSAFGDQPNKLLVDRPRTPENLLLETAYTWVCNLFVVTHYYIPTRRFELLQADHRHDIGPLVVAVEPEEDPVENTEEDSKGLDDYIPLSYSPELMDPEDLDP